MRDPSQEESGAERRSSFGEVEIRLVDYWRILVDRRLIVLSCLTVVVAVTMTLTLLTAPRYRATTTLEIQRYSPEVVEFTDVVNVDPSAYWDFHQTQQRILQSRRVARLAAQELDLPNRPEFATRRRSPLSRIVGLGVFKKASATASGDIESAIRYIQGGLGISLIRGSYLVTATFEDRDPFLAADIANAVADAYQRFQLDSRYTTTGQAKEFLIKDVARVRAEINDLEKKLQAYGVEKEILALSDGTQDISEQAFADINRRYTEARAKLATAEARHESVQSAAPEALPEVLASPLIGHLREQRAELERKYTQMGRRFKSDWPPLLELGEELEKARAQLDNEAETIAAQVRAVARTDYETAKAEFATIAEERQTQKHEVQRVNQDAIDYASLKTEIETKRKVLAGLVERQSETETSYRLRETGASNVRVVDRAEVPVSPVSPRKRLNLILSIVVGLCCGALVAFVVDYLDNSIKTEHDITHNSGLVVLGHVPLTRALGVVDARREDRKRCKLDLSSHEDPKSHFSETFRNLRTSLLLAAPDRPPRHVLVTSCQPGDGKSTVALNLGIVLTQLGKRVLVVDADLRRPRIHRALRLDNTYGLSSFLSGNAPIGGLIQSTEVPELLALPSGPIPPNPSELLGSSRFETLVNELVESNEIDHVVIDSPPLLSVTDSIVVSSRVDSTIVVVRSGVTRREALTESASRLAQSRANVIGAVLNAVREESAYYHRYYWYRKDYAQNHETGTRATRDDRRREAG